MAQTVYGVVELTGYEAELRFDIVEMEKNSPEYRKFRGNELSGGRKPRGVFGTREEAEASITARLTGT